MLNYKPSAETVRGIITDAGAWGVWGVCVRMTRVYISRMREAVRERVAARCADRHERHTHVSGAVFVQLFGARAARTLTWCVQYIEFVADRLLKELGQPKGA
jgi:hypothetical protein